MTDLRSFDQITPADVDAVGGKGLSLGLMAGAGLPVPPGFCVTSAAFRRWRGQSLAGEHDLGRHIADAYRGLGGGPVAVRSSATAEDGAVASFAGQQETFLGVQGEREVVVAVGRCWASLDTERAVAYRRRQGVERRRIGDGRGRAAAGPGRGRRRPVHARPARRRGPADAGRGVVGPRRERRLRPRHAGSLPHRPRHRGRPRTPRRRQDDADDRGGRAAGPGRKQNQPCLDDAQLAELADLGRQVEKFYGGPRDLEWAWADGRFWLLQARPITTAGAAEREQVRREEIAALAAQAEPGGTVWSRFNLSESLPEPTPMTWAIVRRFMSGRGGFGLMYRDLGFKPDPSLDEDGTYDLVAGRPYCNLSREPRFYAGWLPYEHPFAALKADPQKALYPQPTLNAARFGPLFWLLLPVRLPFLATESVAPA